MKNAVIIMANQLKGAAIDILEENGFELKGINLLRERGVEFSRCYTPHPLCVPARISFFSSQFPHTTGFRNNERLIDNDLHHAFIDWKRAGFTTALIGKNHCFSEEECARYIDLRTECTHMNYTPECFSGMEWIGIDKSELKPFTDIERSKLGSTGKIADYPKAYHSTEAIVSQTQYFFKNHKKAPFSVWVSFPYPHEPYVCIEEYFNKALPLAQKLSQEYKKTDGNIPERMKILQKMLTVESDSDLAGVLAAYYGNILHIDEAIYRIVNSLKSNDLYDDSVIVFCSDHGDFSGEYGLTVKGGVFYDCLTKVPLIISSDDFKQGKDNTVVNLIDVIPTVFMLQGMEIPSLFRGKCLPVAEEDPASAYTVSEYGAGSELLTIQEFGSLKQPYDYITAFESIKWRESEGRRKMIVFDKWKYICDPLGDIDELYNLEADKHEVNNLAYKSEYTNVVNLMRSKLLDWAILQEDRHDSAVKQYKLEIIK